MGRRHSFILFIRIFKGFVDPHKTNTLITGNSLVDAFFNYFFRRDGYWVRVVYIIGQNSLLKFERLESLV